MSKYRYFTITTKTVNKLVESVNKQVEYWDNRLIPVKLLQIVQDETGWYTAIMEMTDKYESNI